MRACAASTSVESLMPGITAAAKPGGPPQQGRARGPRPLRDALKLFSDPTRLLCATVGFYSCYINPPHLSRTYTETRSCGHAHVHTPSPVAGSRRPDSLHSFASTASRCLPAAVASRTLAPPRGSQRVSSRRQPRSGLGLASLELFLPGCNGSHARPDNTHGLL